MANLRADLERHRLRLGLERRRPARKRHLHRLLNPGRGQQPHRRRWGSTASPYNAAAIKTNGTVWEWGYGGYGELGNGSTSTASTPVEVSSLSGATSIGAGDTFSIAAKTDGTYFDWGDNTYGQLGNGTTTDTDTPTQVSNLESTLASAPGSNHLLRV